MNAEPVENIQAWQTDTYPFWICRYGQPADVAARISKDPEKTLGSLARYLGPVRGTRIINIMGSNGLKAVALSLLGAEVSVIDVSPGNARYAKELAEAAGVTVRYTVGDVLSAKKERAPTEQYDLAFAELGILHYFTDLQPFMQAVRHLLVCGGKFVLRDFHPVSTKLISYRGPTAKVRKYKVNGDYFSEELERCPVSYSKHMHAGEAPTVLLRRWTIGEIVTLVASAGLRIERLVEEPNLSSEVFDAGIPKTFILIATNT